MSARHLEASNGINRAAELEVEADELMAKGYALRAEAGRLRASAPAPIAPAAEWIPADASPLGKRRTLDLCRSGALESSKIGRKVLVRRASLEAFLRRHERGVEPAADGEDLFGARKAA